MLFNYLFFLKIIIVLYTVFESNVFGSTNIFKRMIWILFFSTYTEWFLGPQGYKPNIMDFFILIIFKEVIFF